FGDGKVEVRDIHEGASSEDQIQFLETDNLFRDLDDE
ncbi:MAG: ribose 5-phosphate isomerase A, partial [Paracoccaceae bacterium]|nr:ribose 5-phosphate isomerase A [Paracoccaceae bacterium]